MGSMVTGKQDETTHDETGQAVKQVRQYAACMLCDSTLRTEQTPSLLPTAWLVSY